MNSSIFTNIVCVFSIVLSFFSFCLLLICFLSLFFDISSKYSFQISNPIPEKFSKYGDLNHHTIIKDQFLLSVIQIVYLG
jgi:hypothetical protein